MENCKEEISRETIQVNATGAHNYMTETERVPATCTVDGYYIMTCACGATEKATLTKTGHSMTHCEAVAPDCTNDGTVEYWSCSNCGKNFSDANGTDSILDAAKGHTLTQVEAKPATCIEKGREAYEPCAVCDYTTYKEVAATDEHSDSETDSNHICDTCDKVMSECSGGSATCTHKAICSTCGAEYGGLAEHSYTNYEPDNNGYKIAQALKELPAEEHRIRRQEKVLPLVEAYFAWFHEQDPATILSEKTRDGLKYSLNQEKYLRVFLEDGNIPIDNSATERAIRPFIIGRANWHIIDNVHGVEASAVIYSLVETAKANNLKIYEYLKHLLTEIPKHMDGTNMDFLENLLPWSEKLPEECHKKT